MADALSKPLNPVPKDRPSPWLVRLLRIDRWLANASEWLNPILVKEARQSLKSRQFVLTFGLLLLAVWGWTAMAVAMLQAQGGIGDRAAQQVFAGYFVILEVPLIVIVPFTAFRSLASERDDGTYELVSITALGGRQIVMGKLASALLQIMVYFSVIAPCIAFTYMLRGIDLITIALLLAYTLAFSIAHVCTGLLFASSVRSIHWQILASVLVLVGLVITAFAWPAFVFDELMRNQMPLDRADFWYGNGFLFSMVAAICWLFLAAASAELSFASDNRSTKLRILMLVVQMVFTGWMVFFTVRINVAPPLIIMSLVATAFWMGMGALMTGERPELSPRVRRSLPKSFLGRMAFTWFNPGSASGYVFAVTNATAVLLAAVMLLELDFGRSLRQFRGRELLACFLALCYMQFYLGLGRLILLGLRRFADFGVVVAFMVQALVAVLGILVPILLHSIFYWNQPGFRYTALQIPNWGLTIISVLEGRGMVVSGGSVFVIVAAAQIMFVVNLVLAAKEVHQLRETTPERVLEDERQRLGIARQPERAAPRSPFDE